MSGQLQDLIARLEKASWPDRELDGEIEAALAAPTFARFDLAKGWHWEFEADDTPGTVMAFAVLGNKTSRKQARYAAPLYTASIDAALTLFKTKPAMVSADPRQVCVEALRQWL